MDKRVVVNNMEALRWLYPNQSFTTNVFYPKSPRELIDLVKILIINKIDYTIKSN